MSLIQAEPSVKTTTPPLDLTPPKGLQSGTFVMTFWGWQLNREIPRSAKDVLDALRSFERGKGYCYPSNESLAKRLKCSERTVERGLKTLREPNIIKIVKGAPHPTAPEKTVRLITLLIEVGPPPKGRRGANRPRLTIVAPADERAAQGLRNSDPSPARTVMPRSNEVDEIPLGRGTPFDPDGSVLAGPTDNGPSPLGGRTDQRPPETERPGLAQGGSRMDAREGQGRNEQIQAGTHLAEPAPVSLDPSVADLREIAPQRLAIDRPSPAQRAAAFTAKWEAKRAAERLETTLAFGVGGDAPGSHPDAHDDRIALERSGSSTKKEPEQTSGEDRSGRRSLAPDVVEAFRRGRLTTGTPCDATLRKQLNCTVVGSTGRERDQAIQTLTCFADRLRPVAPGGPTTSRPGEEESILLRPIATAERANQQAERMNRREAGRAADRNRQATDGPTRLD